MDPETPDPAAMEGAATVLRAAWWSRNQLIAALGHTDQDRDERRRLELEQQALTGVADWLDAQAARMFVP